jgi:tetratricopeptide (TPR) repeat protein
VPVIGLVQAGLWPAMADRFAYVPLIGLFIIIAWGVADLIPGQRYRKIGLAAMAALLSIMMATTWQQVRYWKNSVTLYARGLEVTVDNYILHNNLANALLKLGKVEESIVHCREALRIKPNYALARATLGAALSEQGKLDEAISHFSMAVLIRPDSEGVYYSLGNLYKDSGDLDRAIEQYRKALSIQPDFTDAMNNLALVYVSKGEHDKAEPLFLKMIELEPDSYVPYYNMACLYARENKVEESIDWLKEGVKRGFKDWDFLKNDEDLVNIRRSSYFRELTGSIKHQ